MNPLVSIVTPFFNPCSGGREEAWWRQCIESILRQTHKNLEAIFVSDGSTDHSIDIAFEYADKDRRVKVIKNKRFGVVAALNTGLEAASGEYIGGLSSDDYMSDKYIECLLNGFTPDTWLVGGQRILFEGESLWPQPHTPLTYNDLKLYARKKCPFFHPMYRRKLLNLVEGYPEGYLSAEDYAFWVRVLKAAKCIAIPKEVVYIRKHPFRVSVTHRMEQNESAKRIRAEAGLL